MTDLGVIEYRGVSRPVEMRPGWLIDDEQWREQLAALPEDDATWITEQWALAGGRPPDYDMSWLTMESIGDPTWPLIGVALAAVALVAFLVVSIVAAI